MRDYAKVNCAQLLGWNVLFIARHDMEEEVALAQTQRLVTFMVLRNFLDVTHGKFMSQLLRNGPTYNQVMEGFADEL